MRRRHKRAGWAPTGGRSSSRGIFQWPGEFPLRSVGPKAEVGLPSLQHHSQKRTQITSSYEKQKGFYLPGWDDGRQREPPKGPMHKNLICSHLHWALAEGGLEILEQSLWLVALGRELKEQPPGSLCSVIPNTAGDIFLRQSTPLQMAYAWGEAIAPYTGITLPHHVGLKPGCRLQLG